MYNLGADLPPPGHPPVPPAAAVVAPPPPLRPAALQRERRRRGHLERLRAAADGPRGRRHARRRRRADGPRRHRPGGRRADRLPAALPRQRGLPARHVAPRDPRPAAARRGLRGRARELRGRRWSSRPGPRGPGDRALRRASTHELRDANIEVGRTRGDVRPGDRGHPHPRHPRGARRRHASAWPRATSRRPRSSRSPTCSPSSPSRSARSAGCSASCRAPSSAGTGCRAVLDATGEMAYGERALPQARRAHAADRSGSTTPTTIDDRARARPTATRPSSTSPSTSRPARRSRSGRAHRLAASRR